MDRRGSNSLTRRDDIGQNAVIGAGAVVPKSVPANMVVVGNPAKVVREIDQHQ